MGPFSPVSFSKTSSSNHQGFTVRNLQQAFFPKHGYFRRIVNIPSAILSLVAPLSLFKAHCRVNGCVSKFLISKPLHFPLTLPSDDWTEFKTIVTLFHLPKRTQPKLVCKAYGSLLLPKRWNNTRLASDASDLVGLFNSMRGTTKNLTRVVTNVCWNDTSR